MGHIQKNQKSLVGKTVVITGSTSGVGRAAAEAFCLEGCNVVIVARGQKGIDNTVEYCQQFNTNVLGISADMSVAEDVEKVTKETLHRFRKIDIWINNAGVMASGMFEEIPMEIHHEVIKINLFGYMHGAYNAIKVFKKQQYGILINNVSIGGYMPAPFSAVYSSTKYGIRGMVECLRGEVSNLKDIHICNLYPQLQKSTGNLHSAKYSGFKMNISPFASDPRDTADALVDLAKNPRADLFPDFRSKALTTMYRLFPKIIINSASAAVRLMMKIRNGPDTPGNILEKSDEPLRVYGKKPLPYDSSLVKKIIVVGVGVGLVLLMLKKNSKINSLEKYS